jgi:hypothetical protein
MSMNRNCSTTFTVTTLVSEVLSIVTSTFTGLFIAYNKYTDFSNNCHPECTPDDKHTMAQMLTLTWVGGSAAVGFVVPLLIAGTVLAYRCNQNRTTDPQESTPLLQSKTKLLNESRHFDVKTGCLKVLSFFGYKSQSAPNAANTNAAALKL